MQKYAGKNEQSLSDLQGRNKPYKIWIIGVPEWEDKDIQTDKNIWRNDRIFPNLMKILNFQFQETQ